MNSVRCTKRSGFSVGTKLRELRLEEKLSQEQLALRSGVTSAYIGQIERGEKNPTVVTVEKLCSSLNISLMDFFSFAKRGKASEDSVLSDINKKLENLSVTQLEIVNNVLSNIIKLTDINI